MKTKALLKFIVAVFAAAICSPSFMQAQMMGGDNVLISSFEAGQPEGESRLAVANNGWIYVMAHYKNAADTQVKIFRSVDGGATYQQLKHWYPEGGYQYADFDIVVTGNNASDIRVWSVELLVKDSDSKVVIFRRDADMANSVRIYDETLPNVELYDVAMASNFRAPSPMGVGGNPFALGIAVCGYNKAASPKHSFLDYIFSLDGGATFEKSLLYKQNGTQQIEDVDISIGSTTADMHNTWPLMGIVFAKDGYNNVGFISNFVDNDPAFAWSSPITLAASGNLWRPRIQMMLDHDSENTIGGESCHNFMIVYETQNTIKYAYPKKSFGYLSEPSVDDLNVATLVSNARQPALSYDKVGNHYLFTYATEEDGIQKLKYQWVHYDNLHKPSSWSTKYVYASDYDDVSFYFRKPLVDINPSKVKACWIWFDEYQGGIDLWSDTEWAVPSSIEDIVMQESKIKLYPNPANESVLISLPVAGENRVVLYDLQGRMVAQASFSGKEYKLNVQNLAKGTYMLKVVSDTERFVEKLIVE